MQSKGQMYIYYNYAPDGSKIVVLSYVDDCVYWNTTEMVGDTWSPTASMRTLKYFIADAAKHKARVHQLYFIGAFLQAKVENRVFVKLAMRYADYFPE